MNTHAAHDSVSWRTAFNAYIREYVLCFVLLSLILVWRHARIELPSAHWQIRTGMLQDLVAELPLGRQAAVSSLSFMPLTLIAALPFLPVLPPGAYGYAYLYGLAMLLVLVVHPLNVVLKEAGAARLRGAAILLPVIAAATLHPARHGDLMACLSMFLLVVFFERRTLPEERALAGIFRGLTLFAHAAGLLLLVLHAALAALTRGRHARREEDKAVRWIQRACTVYMLVIFLFLNWMIMGNALYALQTHPLRRAAGMGIDRATHQLEADLKRHGLNGVPIVSGHWGYVIKPLLEARQGYHFIDFHPDKLPSSDNRDLVLVVPTRSNPLAVFADWRPYALLARQRTPPYLLLGQSRDWAFYLIDRSALPAVTVQFPQFPKERTRHPVAGGGDSG